MLIGQEEKANRVCLLKMLEKGEVMKSLINRTKSFLKSEDGPTATEYAVMLALIIVVALTAIQLLGEKVETIFTNVETALPPGS